jgi:hypothetical protein
MHPVAETYTGIIDSLPTDLREAARLLPIRIGLTDRTDGGFEDYSDNGPLYDMPLYVVDDESVLQTYGIEIQQFRKAHHCAGFWGLLSDRIADGQAEKIIRSGFFGWELGMMTGATHVNY